MRPYQLTRSQLYADLVAAYKDARRHKRNKPYQRQFERNMETKLAALTDELWTRTYKPGPSTCFIITDPKQREVFAAQFRDRIVHHLYYNYVHTMLERTFIHDSYSCIRGRGTHYGIDRLERHIRQESQNYREPCYVLKMDVRGYFMHIDRQRLLAIVEKSLWRMASHRISRHAAETWQERVDMDFVCWLTRIIVMTNPVEDCRRRGDLSKWRGLPASKSLFHSPPGCGLPIGNLTSQLFSNVYLNELDQFVKRTLRCRHYGRYVDDFFVVSADRDWLVSLQSPIADFLSDKLGLTVSAGKSVVCDVRQGIDFLGAFLKPHRRYVNNATLKRMKPKIQALNVSDDALYIHNALNSFLGLLCHYRSYAIRRRLFRQMPHFCKYGFFQADMEKYVLYRQRNHKKTKSFGNLKAFDYFCSSN